MGEKNETSVSEKIKQSLRSQKDREVLKYQNWEKSKQK